LINHDKFVGTLQVQWERIDELLSGAEMADLLLPNHN
jgi:hypothetical protein